MKARFLFLAVLGSTGALGSSGLMGNSTGSRQAVLNSAFCRKYECNYVRTEQVGGLTRGSSDLADIYKTGGTQGQTGELGITHAGRVSGGMVNGLDYEITAMPPRLTKTMVEVGTAFFNLALGSRASVQAPTIDIQRCLERAFADLKMNPTGTGFALGSGRFQKHLACDILPTKDKIGLYDVQFSADDF